MSDVGLEEDSGTPSSPPRPSPASGMVGVRATALGVLIIGAIALWQSLGITEGAGYSTIGPRFLPVVVSLALLVLGAAFLVTTTLRPDAFLVRKVADEHAMTYWPTPVLLGVLLVVYAFALGPVGYLVATAVFVPVAARVLGSRKPVRDTVVGVVMALVLFFGFTRALGVRLPDGVLEPLLDVVGAARPLPGRIG